MTKRDKKLIIILGIMLVIIFAVAQIAAQMLGGKVLTSAFPGLSDIRSEVQRKYPEADIQVTSNTSYPPDSGNSIKTLNVVLDSKNKLSFKEKLDIAKISCIKIAMRKENFDKVNVISSSPMFHGMPFINAKIRDGEANTCAQWLKLLRNNDSNT